MASRLPTGIRRLKHKAARRLCDRGILRADEDTVLLLFTRKVYPEVNPIPERKLVERLRAAIFAGAGAVDPRTTVLVALADAAELLGETFRRKEVRSRRERIKQIAQGDLTGRATKEAIAAFQTAAMVAAIMPVVVTAAARR